MGNSDPSLASVKSWESYFYPAKDFSVKNYTLSKGISIDLPNYLYVSNNYYQRSWSMKTHRRLKNIIVIMDFSPSKSAMIEISDVGKALSKVQERNVKNAFQEGEISIAEVREVLKAVDIDLEGDEGEKFMATIQNRPNGKIGFDDLKRILSERMHFRIQANRHYVALSLAEAACMRAVIHSKQGQSFFADRDTIVGLRTERTLLDASTFYEPAISNQDWTSRACYRFLDNAINFTPREISLLLRALQNNSCKNRLDFYLEVRSNRRRKEIDPASTSLQKVFVTEDEHHMLQYQIAKGRVTALLKSRGMYARDAFALFDLDRDSLLSYGELKRGLDRLGMKQDDTTIVNDLMNEIDKDKDGFVNLDEFKSAVDWEDDGATIGNYSGELAPLPVLEPSVTGGLKGTVKIPAQILAGIKVKVKEVTKFNLVWTSQGSMSRLKGSVWAPVVGTGALRANRAYVSLGHYIGTGYDNPNRDNKPRLTLEITDTQGSFVGGSNWLPLILDTYMPRPARFRMAWSFTHGGNPFYAWEPIPPSEDFAALGYVGSTTDTPPDVRCMRCITKNWLTESTSVQKVWDDSGSGGREGSIWQFNSLNLVGFVSGHEPPARRPWDLKSRRFFLRDYNEVKTEVAVAPAAGSFGNPL
jgi:Ca2+-binding EF-hand superfamily protein